MNRPTTKAQRARRGFGVERQRTHREASTEPRRPRQAPLLSRAERMHLWRLEVVAMYQAREAAAQAKREAESAESEAAGVGEGERKAATDGAVEASPPTPALPTPEAPDAVPAAARAGDRLRDPRLGAYLNVGTFLHHCWRRLGLTKTEVFAVAGLASDASVEALLLFEGGLAGLYRACEAKKKARAA